MGFKLKQCDGFEFLWLCMSFAYSTQQPKKKNKDQATKQNCYNKRTQFILIMTEGNEWNGS